MFLVSYLRTHHQVLGSECSTFLSRLIPTESVTILCLNVWSMFTLIYVLVVRCGSRFIFFVLVWLGFCLWISSCSSTICWKDCSSYIELTLHLFFEKSLSVLVLGYFWVLYFISLIHISSADTVVSITITI